MALVSRSEVNLCAQESLKTVLVASRFRSESEATNHLAVPSQRPVHKRWRLVLLTHRVESVPQTALEHDGGLFA